MTYINKDSLRQILNYGIPPYRKLNYVDKISTVSKTWHSIAAEIKAALFSLGFFQFNSAASNIPNDQINYICDTLYTTNCLKFIKIRGGNTTELQNKCPNTKFTPPFTELQYLNISESLDNTSFNSKAGDFTNLQSLFDSACSPDVTYLNKLPQLTTLILGNREKPSNFLEIPKLKNLTDLSMNAKNLTKIDIQEIAQLKNLKRLIFSQVEDKEALSALSQLTQLNSLAIKYSMIGLGVMEKLNKLTQLSELILSHTLTMGGGHFNRIMEFKNLKILNIKNIDNHTKDSRNPKGCDTIDMTHLNKLRFLTALDCSSTIIGNSSFEKIERLFKLKVINCYDTKTTTKAYHSTETIPQSDLKTVYHSDLTKFSELTTLFSLRYINAKKSPDFTAVSLANPHLRLSDNPEFNVERYIEF